ncbi:hypothetical protein D5301_11940 [Stenotrophomonas sp. MH181796]|nr:hypothetical protein [Stenotrophomonas sp. MH181796]
MDEFLSDIEIQTGVGSVFLRKTDPTPCRSDSSRKTVEGGVGPVAGVSAAWMPRPSPQGRVYGDSRNRTHPAHPRTASFCR